MAGEGKHKKRSKRRKKKDEANAAGGAILTPQEAGRQVYPAPEPPTVQGMEEPPEGYRIQKEQTAGPPGEPVREKPVGTPTVPPTVDNGVSGLPRVTVPPTVDDVGERGAEAQPPEASHGAGELKEPPEPGQPGAAAQPPGTEPEAGGLKQPPEPGQPGAATQTPPGFQGYGQYSPQQPWYPAMYPPPQFYGYPPVYQQVPPVEAGGGYAGDERTGQIPVIPRQPVPAAPPFIYPPTVLPPGDFSGPPRVPMMPTFQPTPEAGFESLTGDEDTHWRVDGKWVFGIITTLLLFLTITAMGLFRISGRGESQEIAVRVIDGATSVRSAVEDNYQDIKEKARRNKKAQIVIPDIGVEVSMESETITSLGSEELADTVILEIERQLYNQGYYGDLPMKPAQGVGEERGKATSGTILAWLNRSTHDALVWPMLILGIMAVLFAVPFLIFCRRWGKVTGFGVVCIAASLPALLYIRIGCRFLWKAGAAGLYKGVVLNALSDSGSLMLVYYDIAFGVGVLLLLVGIVVGVLSRRSRERVPPFEGLQEPTEFVAGGPAVGAPGSSEDADDSR